MSATLKDHAHDCAVVGKATESHTEGGVSKIIELVFHVPINSFWSKECDAILKTNFQVKSFHFI